MAIEFQGTSSPRPLTHNPAETYWGVALVHPLFPQFPLTIKAIALDP